MSDSAVYSGIDRPLFEYDIALRLRGADRKTYVAIHFGDEEDAIVRAHAAPRVVCDHLNWLRRLLFVVGHLERREWVTTVEGEGCKSILLILEVYIGHAVDG